MDEFAASGLTPVPSELGASAARGRGSRVNGVPLVQIVHVSPKPLGGSLVIGEVVRFHVDDSICSTDYKIDPDALQRDRPNGRPDLLPDNGPLRHAPEPVVPTR